MRDLHISNSDLLILVDDEDWVDCSIINWSLKGRDLKQIEGSATGRGRIHIANYIMQDFINQYDHKDGNFLNNQRKNLRIATNSQNGANKGKQKGEYSSKYKGVSFFSRDNNWRAHITKNHIFIHLGYFNSEINAAKAYNEAAIKYFGEFAKLNHLLMDQQQLM